MGRIKHYAAIAGRTLTRTPLPDFVYEIGFGKVRIAKPPAPVQKRHAIDIELINRTRTVWLDKHKADRGIIVYLHGGSYMAGPFVGDWEWLSKQVDERECAGLLIDYRYGPDYMHPTAIEDTFEVIKALAAEGLITQGNWAVAGHQSGAGLALSLASLVNTRVDGGLANAKAKPAGIVLMNPLLDLEFTNLELSETNQHDPVHERRIMQLAAKKYAGRTPLDDPALSPLNGDLQGLPPVHLSVGTKDLFLTDSRIVTHQFEREEVELTYREIPGKISVTPRLRRGADMARLLEEQREFLEANLAETPGK